MSYVLQIIFAACYLSYYIIDMFFKSVYQCFKTQGGLQADPDYAAHAAEG